MLLVMLVCLFARLFAIKLKLWMDFDEIFRNEMLTVAQGIFYLISIVILITVWIQTFLKDILSLLDRVIFGICVYTFIINCQITCYKNTEHSHNSVYNTFGLDHSKKFQIL